MMDKEPSTNFKALTSSASIFNRPYNIGDRIHVSGIETDTSFDGAPGWTVEHVNLFETIAR